MRGLFTAEASVYQASGSYRGRGGQGTATAKQAVVPQFSICSPCLSCVGFSRKLCCSTHWGWPPISCSLQSC